MKGKKITIGLAVLSFMCNLIIYPLIPNKLPHYIVNNVIDGYSGKWPVFILAFLPIGMFFLMMLISKLDSRNEKNKKVFEVSTFFSVLTFIAMNWVFNMIFLGLEIDVLKVTNFIMGLLFIGLGNYMPQVKTNKVFGIRTPWTLADENVWKKTHRFGGYVLIIGGVVSFACAFINGYIGMIAVSIIITIVIGIICLYSYMEYKRLKKYEV